MPGQVLVKFAARATDHQIETLAQAQGLQTLRHFSVPASMENAFKGQLYQFSLPAGETVDEAIERLNKQPGVLYAEPNYKIHIDDPTPAAQPSAAETRARSGNVPDDLDSRLWGLENHGQDGGTPGKDIGATEAWKTTTGKPNGEGPLIVVIDTGIDYTHDDLKANCWTNPGEIPGNGVDDDGNGVVDDVHGANFATDSGDPLDDHGHGTHCAGTIGAVGNNGQGVVGVNWNATIASAKFLDADGSGTYADALEAVLYAEKIGARITSNSWGGPMFSQALYDAFAASNALHIVAAGNAGTDSDGNPHFPAAFDLDNIVSVAATDRNGELAGFSNYGATSVDVAAPGVDIYSLAPGNGFETMSGTSMAAPHVTGVAGLLLAHHPELTNAEVKARLMNTA
ncbi:MAG: hypothetical protein EB084_25305, partial [Proteobacteria bacterium]|nr:hypothetical protein [Pseudomonadota bacterium]